jgi:hypothetical protein
MPGLTARRRTSARRCGSLSGQRRCGSGSPHATRAPRHQRASIFPDADPLPRSTRSCRGGRGQPSGCSRSLICLYQPHASDGRQEDEAAAPLEISDREQQVVPCTRCGQPTQRPEAATRMSRLSLHPDRAGARHAGRCEGPGQAARPTASGSGSETGARRHCQVRSGAVTGSQAMAVTSGDTN